MWRSRVSCCGTSAGDEYKRRLARGRGKSKNLTWESCTTVRSWVLLEGNMQRLFILPTPLFETHILFSLFSYCLMPASSPQNWFLIQIFLQVSQFCGRSNCRDIILKTHLEANNECLQHMLHFPPSIESCTSLAQVAEDRYISRTTGAKGIQFQT